MQRCLTTSEKMLMTYTIHPDPTEADEVKEPVL